MKRVVVRYKLKADRVAEHEALLGRVFEQLTASAPPGLGYDVWKLADGVSFIHVASVAGADNPLLGLSAFKEFSADIRGRCEEPPVSSEGTLAGSYTPTS